MDNALQRLKQYIDYKGLNISSVEKSVGLSNGSLSNQLKKNKTIGVDKLEKILKTYLDLSPEWLLTGEGSMVKAVSNPSSESTPREGIERTLRKFYTSEEWQLAKLIKSEVHQEIKASLSSEVEILKEYRDLTAKVLKFINYIDAPLDENNEALIYDDLLLGKNKTDILEGVKARIAVIKELSPLINVINKNLQESIVRLKPFDTTGELKSNGQDKLVKHLLDQEYEIVARLQDKVKVYRKYVL